MTRPDPMAPRGPGAADRRRPAPADLSPLAVPRGAAAGFAGAWQTPATAAAAPPEPVSRTLGSFRVTALSDGALALPNPVLPEPAAASLFVDAPPAARDAALRAVGLAALADDPAAVADYPLTPLLVETGRHLVLLDPGFGAAAGAVIPGVGTLLPGLAALGVAPVAIDVVVISHGHADHLLGAITDGAPTFPNARYRIGRAEHAFWRDDAALATAFPDAAERANLAGPARAAFAALGDRLEPIDDAAEAEIVPGLRAVAAPGHTPGHLAVLVESAGERLYALFDTLTHPLHAAHPGWNFATDVLRGQVETTRRGLLDRAAADRALVHAYHCPFPGFARVERWGDAWRWLPVVAVGGEAAR